MARKQFLLTSTNPRFACNYHWEYAGVYESNDLSRVIRLAMDYADKEDGHGFTYCVFNRHADPDAYIGFDSVTLVTPMTIDAMFTDESHEKFTQNAILFFCDYLRCTADEIEFPLAD